MTITDAGEALRAGRTTSEALTEACLQETQSLNGAINAVLETFADEARAAARDADARRARGESRGPLDGIPVLLKDNILYAGKVASAGSRILATHVAAEDATVTRRLKEAGAVILGRANMDEFAMGSSTERSAFGPTRHPKDFDRVPGGSSGGSAAAVAADFCLAALGSDTGGSIRQPAAFCGVVGLKPTYGSVSRSGLIAMASSLDQIGPLARSVADARIVFEALAGKDPKDQTAVERPSRAAKSLKGLRIGLPRQAWGQGMEDGVRAATSGAAEALRALGAELVEVDLPYADEALAAYYVLMPCEVSANLSRFDGMRYGLRLPGYPLAETMSRSRAEGFGPEARRRVLVGAFALSRGYYDAYYLQAKRVQTLIRRGYEAAFRDVDLLLTPTAPTTAFKIGEKTTDPLAMYLEDVFTVGVNVAGLPALSVPCGSSDGLPVGMQLIAPWFDEPTLLATAEAYEAARGSELPAV